MRYFSIILIGLVFSINSDAQRVWTFTEFKQNYVSSADTVYVINFWATWCKPCVKELPEFQKAVNKYQNQPVQFYFLSLDFGKNALQKANAFLDRKGYSFNSFLTTDDNADQWIPMVDESWSGAIPATVIYKGNKKVFHEGKITTGQLLRDINQLLN